MGRVDALGLATGAEARLDVVVVLAVVGGNHARKVAENFRKFFIGLDFFMFFLNYFFKIIYGYGFLIFLWFSIFIF